MRYLKTNTATSIVVGPFLDSTDGVSPETGLTVTGIHATLVVDNAGTPTLALDADLTASGGNNDCAHITNDDAGMYSMELAAANVNYLGGAILTLVVSGACPVFHEFTILPALVYDSLIGGSDNLQVDAIQVGGTTLTARDIGASVLISSGTGTGQLSVSSGVIAANLTQVGGVAQSATDLKDFADTGYDPSTHKVAGVVLTDTLTTYTGNTPQTGDSFARIGATGSGLTSLAQAADLSTDAEIADAVWDEVLSGHTTAGTGGKVLADAATAAALTVVNGIVDAITATLGAAGAGLTALGDTRIANLDAAVSSRSTLTAQQVWEYATRILTAGTNIALAKGTGVTGFTDLSAADVRTAVGLATANLDTQLAAIVGYIDTEIAAITTLLGTPSGATISADLLSLLNRLTALRAGYLDNLSAGAVATAASVAALNNLSAAQVNAEVVDVLRTDTLPDSVAADGSASTIAQAMYLILQFLTEKSVTSTTLTVKKPDGSTTLATFTLNDASAPTSITRAT